MRTLSDDDVKRLREAARALGNDGAYSTKTVIMLCDELLADRKMLETMEAFCKSVSNPFCALKAQEN